jgi:hypothetical protein
VDAFLEDSPRVPPRRATPLTMVSRRPGVELCHRWRSRWRSCGSMTPQVNTWPRWWPECLKCRLPGGVGGRGWSGRWGGSANCCGPARSACRDDLWRYVAGVWSRSAARYAAQNSESSLTAPSRQHWRISPCRSALRCFWLSRPKPPTLRVSSVELPSNAIHPARGTRRGHRFVPLNQVHRRGPRVTRSPPGIFLPPALRKVVLQAPNPLAFVDQLRPCDTRCCAEGKSQCGTLAFAARTISEGSG